MTVLSSPTTEFTALGFNPAPGELGVVGDLAQKYDSVGKSLTDANEALTKIVNQEGIWTGSGSEAFARRVGDLPEYLTPAGQSMTLASQALGGWQTDLARMQERAHELEMQARQAAEQAQQARANPDFALANQTFPDQRSLRIAQQLLANAEQQLRQAIGHCEDIQKLAEQLLAQHTEIAEQVAQTLNKAKAMAPDEPGLIGQALDALGDMAVDVSNALTDAVNEVWNFVQDNANLLANISDVVADIAAFVDVAADFFPPLEGVATGLSAVALAGHTVAKLAGGDVPPEVLAYDVAGLVPIPGLDTATMWGGQAVANAVLTKETIGRDFVTIYDDLQDYWVPQNAAQWALTGSVAVGFTGGPAITAFWNAAESGVAEDNAPERQLERAKDQVWE